MLTHFQFNRIFDSVEIWSNITYIIFAKIFVHIKYARMEHKRNAWTIRKELFVEGGKSVDAQDTWMVTVNSSARSAICWKEAYVYFGTFPIVAKIITDGSSTPCSSKNSFYAFEINRNGLKCISLAYQCTLQVNDIFCFQLLLPQ